MAMNRSASRWVVWGTLMIGMAGWLAARASADVTKEDIASATETVQRALRSEATGANEDRDKLLRQALDRLPNCPSAMWHTGYVREGEQWVKYDEVTKRSVQDATLAEYRKVRDASPATSEGQVAVARWCNGHGLSDRMRAHATAALELDQDNADARQLLGFRRVGGVWVSPNDTDQARRQAGRNAADLEKWGAKLKPLVPRLAQADQPEYDRAVKIILAIDDPAAIPAMEAILMPASKNAALCLAYALSRMSASPEAAAALARLAVLSSEQDVREAAIAAMQKRSLEHYVPVLLSGMSAPIIAKAELYTSPRGRLVYRQTFEREGQYFSDKTVVETEYRERLSTGRSGAVAPRSDVEARINRDVGNRQGNVAQAVAAQNANIALVNQRICETLARTTGHELENPLDSWWDWWNSHNEVYLEGSKPVREAYVRQYVKAPPPPPPPPPSVRDCLVAGTSVWTDTGLVPVEQVRVGDLVLSQEPDTGRIAYQPVLRTTVRAIGQVVRIVYEDGFLQCSGGHPFWISGQGWVKARDIQEGSFFHTLNGAVPVLSVSLAGTEETYNLIVAESHSYFITDALILSHDNTIRDLTAAVVPGLKRLEEASSK
jgi:hypothetical protein